MLDLRSRGLEGGKVVMEDTIRPDIKGRARVKAERVRGIGREWRRAVCML